MSVSTWMGSRGVVGADCAKVASRAIRAVVERRMFEVAVGLGIMIDEVFALLGCSEA